MSVSFELKMQPRDCLGTAASRRLRRLEDRVTVSLSGNDGPLNLSVDHASLSRILQNDHFSPSSIIKIIAGDKVYPAIFKKLKRDPVKPKILDVELLHINENKPMQVSVPLAFAGEAISPGIKVGGGRVSYQLTSIIVNCLPKDLPQEIKVDISKLDLNETITLFQLIVPENVVLAEKIDRVVVSMIAPRGQLTANGTDTPAEE